MIKAVIFDCFGVIYASRLDVFLDTHSDKAIRNEIMDNVRAYDVGLLDKDALLQNIMAATGSDKRAIEETLFSGFTINPALVSSIAELRPRYKTGLLTNIGPNVYASLEPKLAPLFDAVVTSFSAGIAKPEPKIYQLIAQKLNTAPEECLFIDDQQRHCDGAIQVGMQALLYEDVHQFKKAINHLLEKG